MSMHMRIAFSWLLAGACLLTFDVSQCSAADGAPASGTANSAAAPIVFKPLLVPKAMVMVGPWGDMFRWREALHAAGVMYDDAYRSFNIYRGGHSQLIGMPENRDWLGDYSVIVLVNVDAPTIGAERLDAIARFVRQGGGLVVLGGSWAFSRGGYAGTPLETLLPVECPEEHRIPWQEAGLALRPETTNKWKVALDGKQPPLAFFVQTLRPRATATVEWRAGDRPAIVTGTSGQGNVVACGLTIHGEVPADGQAFWDWAEWPNLLGQSIDWAASSRPLQGSGKSTTAAKPLSEDEISQARLGFQPINEEFVARFIASPSQAAADTIFGRLSNPEGPKLTLSAELVHALAAHVQAEWETPLLKMADELDPDRAQRFAALELLGAVHSPAATKLLLAGLEDRDAAPAALDGLRRSGDVAHVPAIMRVYKQSIALADFRHPDGQESSGPAAIHHGIVATHAAVALYGLGEREGVSRMAGLYRETRLMRRVVANATKRRVSEYDPTGIAILKALYGKWGDFARLETYLLGAAGPVPTVQQGPFLEFAQAAGDDDEVRWLAAALSESPSGGQWLGLKDANDGIVRRLGGAVSAK